MVNSHTQQEKRNNGHTENTITKCNAVKNLPPTILSITLHSRL